MPTAIQRKQTAKKRVRKRKTTEPTYADIYVSQLIHLREVGEQQVEAIRKAYVHIDCMRDNVVAAQVVLRDHVVASHGVLRDIHAATRDGSTLLREIANSVRPLYGQIGDMSRVTREDLRNQHNQLRGDISRIQDYLTKSTALRAAIAEHLAKLPERIATADGKVLRAVRRAYNAYKTARRYV